MKVVKIGGSLLDWPEFPAKFAAWLDLRKRDRLVLIVGGGRAADWIRDIDRIHKLGDEKSHDLAVWSLELTARVVAAMVPGLIVVETAAMLKTVWESGLIPILPPRVFLGDDSRPLLKSWEFTSDSIAARVAVRLGADELILLKSANCPQGSNLAEAARLGLVDPSFPREAELLQVVTVTNFRENLKLDS